MRKLNSKLKQRLQEDEDLLDFIMESFLEKTETRDQTRAKRQPCVATCTNAAFQEKG